VRFLSTLCVLIAANVHAAVVYDFTPVTQQVDALLQNHPSINGASLIVIRDGSVI
jgi:hypothetical protein